ncbi:MAG: flagellar biosynthesis protein FlhF [Curvibacter lanceolatus]|jgi:flagellar biosynthesis protein FlhF|uniref:flagellar biosynthesis protein FlhF n=1 Tax=Curvibacter lanceolatus TaxID=86182 RepID=UPI00036E6558|nr:flagellar biosynthesis protein FlhF [Curvibacter lanceolatus]MBV5293187.1 flagellar biosynthesis protein FlhF [Curvibacter lanceolatus]
MNIKRFHAATSREALAKARMAFGEGTLILSNRPTANGVEVMATGEDALSALEQHTEGGPSQGHGLTQVPGSSLSRKLATMNPPELGPRGVREDTAELAMSTLSFQDYVRERMLRRRQEAMAAEDNAPMAPRTQREMPAPAPKDIQPIAFKKAPAPRPAVTRPVFEDVTPSRAKAPVAQAAAPAVNQQGIVNELQAMKELIEERFNTLAWLGQAKQDPIQSNLMLKMIRAGYSPALARAILERLPAETGPAEAVRWLMEVLERNLKTDADSYPLYEEGGIFALVGATGVGKTTTAAKLAALCARVHGPGSVGLITLDTYRIAAHEQLRTYGRMLGVVAHLAHDRAALQDLLGLLGNKKMVLIDTTGLAPRDPRKREMLDVLDLPGIQKLLVVNAGSHGDTIDDTLSCFKTTGVQQTILSKVDEAVKLGPALDALIRHQVVLRGVTNGQRVPEDWEAADAGKLVRASMRTPGKSAFDPKAVDLNYFFSNSNMAVSESAHV